MATKITDKKKEKIKELIAKGMSERAVAKKLNISRGAVWYHKQR